MTVGLRHIWIGFLATMCLLPVHSAAQVPTPRLKPEPAQLSSHLLNDEAKNLRAGLRAASRKQWTSVESYRQKLSDPVAQDVLVWIQAMKDPNVSFDKLTYVTTNLQDWPRMTGIQAKAEYRLFDEPKPSDTVLRWFAGKEPKTGEGRAALANAHYAKGNDSGGDVWLKSAWREAKLTRDRQRAIYRKHKNRLTPEDHAARADYLIWQGSAHFSKAQGLLSLMNSGDRNLMDARMRVLRNGPARLSAD